MRNRYSARKTCRTFRKCIEKYKTSKRLTDKYGDVTIKEPVSFFDRGGHMTTKQIAQYGLLTSIILVLGLVERQFVLVPGIPGIRLGLSNTVLLYALCLLSMPGAWLMMVLKAVLGRHAVCRADGRGVQLCGRTAEHGRDDAFPAGSLFRAGGRQRRRRGRAYGRTDSALARAAGQLGPRWRRRRCCLRRPC